MKKVIYFFVSKIKNNRKKLITLSVFYLLYRFGQLRHFKTLGIKILELVSRILMERLKKQSIKTQALIEQRIKIDSIISRFITKELADNKIDIKVCLDSHFPTGEAIMNLKTKQADQAQKLKQFEETLKMILKKALNTIIAQYFFDIRRFLATIVKNRENFENEPDKVNVPLNIDRTTSDDETPKTERKSSIPIKKRLSRQGDLNTTQMSNMKEKNTPSLENFNKLFFNHLINDFIAFLNENVFDEMVDEFFRKNDIKGKMDIGTLITFFREAIDSIFSVNKLNQHTQGGSTRMTTIKIDQSEIKLVRSSYNIFGILINKLFYSKNINKGSLFYKFISKYRGLSIDPETITLLKNTDNKKEVDALINFELDFIGSDYFIQAAKFSTEYQLNRFFNRLVILFKKKFGEDNIFNKDSKEVLGKMLMMCDNLLNEEFYSRETFLIEREVLEKRLKFALFILKKNSEDTKEEDDDEKMVDELNCTFVRTLDPFDKKTQLTTYLAMRERVSFETFVYILKEFFRQVIRKKIIMC